MVVFDDYTIMMSKFDAPTMERGGEAILLAHHDAKQQQQQQQQHCQLELTATPNTATVVAVDDVVDVTPLLAVSSEKDEVALQGMELDDNVVDTVTTTTTTTTAAEEEEPSSSSLSSSSQEEEGEDSTLSFRGGKRRVTFSEKQLEEHANDHPFLFTEEEKAVCFGSRRDRARYEQDRVDVFLRFEFQRKHGRDDWEETDEWTLRGLEDFFGPHSKEEKRRTHVLRVLREQERQRQTPSSLDDAAGNHHDDDDYNDNDDDTLRYVSSESSGKCRIRATEIARHDAIARLQFYMEGNPPVTPPPFMPKISAHPFVDSTIVCSGCPCTIEGTDSSSIGGC